MGSDSGQDNERPVHRVWVDAFLMAACQVRNSDYSQFLQETKVEPRRSGHTCISNTPTSRWLEFRGMKP